MRHIEEKMAAFTDAGLYEQDAHIDFVPEGHVYLYDGQRQLLPVSSLIAYFFEPFDAQQQAKRQWERYRIPVEESLTKWERIGRMASEVGTFVHEQTERWFKDGTFETVCPFCFRGKTEEVSVEREKQQFLCFIRDYDIHPYRQEWPVYDLEIGVAGTIDMICREADGTFTIYDWKRSKKVVNALGQPIVEAFGGKTSINGITLPDTSFYHYCLQQNLYRYMLETHYGICVSGMNLVVLCPDYPTYFVAPVPRMDALIRQIVTICRDRDLGHQLLTMRDNHEERFPIVDEEGRVVGAATRGECHNGSRLLHPVVHLHVFNSQGEVYLQKRPAWKDIQPGKWDTSVGGHVDYGETPEQALVREVREELGITDFQPERIGQYVFDSQRERELVYVNRTIYDGPVIPSEAELDGGRFWSLEEIRAAIGRQILTPNFESEFQRFFL